MSIDAITAVLERSQLVGTAKLVLVNLAWHANADGEAWPSQETLARKSGKITVRQVRRCLQEAAAAGEIVEAGSSHRNVVKWRLAILDPGHPCPGSDAATPDTHVRVQKRPRTSVTATPDIQGSEPGHPCPTNRKEPLEPSKGKALSRGEKEAGDGSDTSASQPTIERLFETMRRELGEHAFKTWLQPLQVVDQTNGSLTFRAPTRCHCDWVTGRYADRMRTLAGLPVEVVIAGAAAAPPTARPPEPAPRPADDHPDRPDFSQLLQQMPPGDDSGAADRQPPPLPTQPAPTASMRRKVSGFTRAELERGALDAPWPPPQPPPSDGPAGSTPHPLRERNPPR